MTDFPLNPSMCIEPARLTPSAWIGHIPFAAWIVQEAAPRLFVELGTHHGASYLAFCQAVKENRLGTACFAVDTWQGDEHAGSYGDEVFEALSEYHQVHYAGFSQLLRMTFDEAASCFDDGSVDLLHIDGLHTYEAVKHDFETWLPKMSDGGVVLFHDTMVRERNFGVWRLWEELTARYPYFEFNHAHGLGVLLVGSQMPAALLKLAEAAGDEGAAQSIRRLFERLAQAVEAESTRDALRISVADLARDAGHHLDMLGQQSEIIRQRDLQLVELHEKVGDRDKKVAELHGAVASRDRKVEELCAQVDHLDRQVVELRAHIEERDSRLVELYEKVGDRDDKVAELHGAVAIRDRKVEALSAQVEHFGHQVVELHQHLEERDGRLVELHEKVGDRDGKVAELYGLVGERDRRIEALSNQMEEVDARITHEANSLSEQLARLDSAAALGSELDGAGTHASLPSDARSKDNAVSMMQQLTTVESRIHQRVDGLSSMRERIVELVRRSSYVESQLDKSRAEIEEMRGSTSWRCTSPLRWVSALLTGRSRG